MLFIIKLLLPRIIISAIVLVITVAIYIYAVRNKEKLENTAGLTTEELGKYQNLQVQMFTKEGCSFCEKAVKRLSEANILTNTQLINIDTPSGKQEFNQTGEVGVPCFKSIITQKIRCGYTDNLSQLIKDLE